MPMQHKALNSNIQLDKLDSSWSRVDKCSSRQIQQRIFQVEAHPSKAVGGYVLDIYEMRKYMAFAASWYHTHHKAINA